MSTCLSCGVGNFSLPQQTTCQICAAGFYQTAQSSSMCTSCVGGTFSSTPGSTLCYACITGNYSATYGPTSCFVCESGTVMRMNIAGSCGSNFNSPCAATQSSTSRSANYAVDGSKSMDSYSETQKEWQPWLKIDPGATRKVTGLICIPNDASIGPRCRA
mmetsp:Transcript_12928/g.35843  ORF Transcript_12928/g.35843 Transcript_12928/m.35843 type:complete len:160 (+) Transcript_12928:988-1467(+)